MSLKLYNTLTRKRELFKSIGKEVGLYTCGPTVYHYAHIGNLRSYIFEDILKRTLLFNKFKVKHVMNITDVGHLTSDADAGEDKMLKGAKREKKTVWEIAEFYTDAFKRDIKKLNIIKPDFWPRATDHITEQIAMIKKLEKKGFTYTAGGNVYFDSTKLKDYGKLARHDLTKEGQARVEKDHNKKNPLDFVLWFTKSKFDDQAMKWKSPWGTGYPGWHIECSAMASKYLGEHFDIHCGGIDHIPVHHSNEIAQSEAAFGGKWVNYWLHNEFLVLGKGEKMAKSGENFLTLGLLKEKGYDPLDFRYFCLGTVYKNPLTFSFEALTGARIARKKLFEKVLTLNKNHGDDNKTAQKTYISKFTDSINDDLNTPKALAVMWDVLADVKLNDHDKHILLLKFDKIFGFNLGQLKRVKVPREILELAKQRLIARRNKDWKIADDLREKIFKQGYVVGDSQEGFELTKR